jgi:hypothetical protein
LQFCASLLPQRSSWLGDASMLLHSARQAPLSSTACSAYEFVSGALPDTRHDRFFFECVPCVCVSPERVLVKYRLYDDGLEGKLWKKD